MHAHGTDLYPLSCRWCTDTCKTSRHVRQCVADDAKACLLPAAQQPPAPQYVNRMQHTSRKHAETSHPSRQRCSMWHRSSRTMTGSSASQHQPESTTLQQQCGTLHKAISTASPQLTGTSELVKAWWLCCVCVQVVGESARRWCLLAKRSAGLGQISHSTPICTGFGQQTPQSTHSLDNHSTATSKNRLAPNVLLAAAGAQHASQL
jgi:hypothetical protein